MSYPSTPPPSGGVNPYGDVPDPISDAPAPPDQGATTPGGFPTSGYTPPVPPPPPGYSQAGYGQPGYGQQSYGQQGPPPGYAAPGGPPQGAPGYSPYLTSGGFGGPVGGYGSWASSRDNGKATGALVMGIVSVVLCATSLISLGLGIGAIVMAVNARRAVASGTADNPGVATAGLVLGIIGCVLGAIASLGYLANLAQS